MRHPYIFVLVLIFAALLHGCGGSQLPDMREPNTLSSRVGNFAPAKIDSDKAEIRAAKNVTPLPKGSRDLDGREENFDPAFGSPEDKALADSGGDANDAPVLNPQQRPVTKFDAQGGSRFGEPGNVGNQPVASAKITPIDTPSQSQRFDQIASGQEQKKAQAENPPPVDQIPVVKPVDSVRFGLAEGTAAPTNFVPTRSLPPITDVPSARSAGTPQGIGCPPSGMASLNANMMRQGGSIATAPLTGPRVAATQYNQFRPQQPQYAPPPSQAVAPYAQSPPTAPVAPTAPAQISDAAVIDAQSNREKDVNVTFSARVKRLLPDDRQGSPHQRFLLGLSNGTTVLVAHNIDLAPYVPLKEGDLVTISGEYIWNEKGGVVHYTHRPTNYRHRGGYIEYNRQTYQ